jgi:hypothetical protein
MKQDEITLVVDVKTKPGLEGEYERLKDHIQNNFPISTPNSTHCERSEAIFAGKEIASSPKPVLPAPAPPVSVLFSLAPIGVQKLSAMPKPD